VVWDLLAFKISLHKVPLKRSSSPFLYATLDRGGLI